MLPDLRNVYQNAEGINKNTKLLAASALKPKIDELIDTSRLF